LLDGRGMVLRYDYKEIDATGVTAMLKYFTHSSQFDGLKGRIGNGSGFSGEQREHYYALIEEKVEALKLYELYVKESGERRDVVKEGLKEFTEVDDMAALNKYCKQSRTDLNITQAHYNNFQNACKNQRKVVQAAIDESNADERAEIIANLTVFVPTIYQGSVVNRVR